MRVKSAMCGEWGRGSKFVWEWAMVGGREKESKTDLMLDAAERTKNNFGIMVSYL